MAQWMKDREAVKDAVDGGREPLVASGETCQASASRDGLRPGQRAKDVWELYNDSFVTSIEVLPATTTMHYLRRTVQTEIMSYPLHHVMLNESPCNDRGRHCNHNKDKSNMQLMRSSFPGKADSVHGHQNSTPQTIPSSYG